MIETAVYNDARPSTDFNMPAEIDESPFPSNSPGGQIKMAPLPSLEVGASFINAYMSYIQPNFPFMSKKKLWEIHQNRKGLEDATTNEPRHDYGILQLVYAIGSRCLQLIGSGNTNGFDPEDYYNSAMSEVQDQLNSLNKQNIEIILLVAIYALRSPSSKLLVRLGFPIHHFLHFVLEVIHIVSPVILVAPSQNAKFFKKNLVYGICAV
jgi:hypothetical protein